MSDFQGAERRMTFDAQNHTLTTCNAFTCDSREILYDNRTPGRGPSRIESVCVASAESRVVYANRTGARAAVVTCHPFERRIVFIKELDHPEINGGYQLWCRQGAMLSLEPGADVVNIDSRDVYAPFTPGALRGGSHVHVFSPDGKLMSNTYDDAVLVALGQKHDCAEGEANLRNVEVNVFGHPVPVPDRPGNVSGCAFTYAVASLRSDPRPGSDELYTATEEGFIGTNGYVLPNGRRQNHALAFVGKVMTESGELCPEVYIADLPEGEITPGDGPLEGTPTRRPFPPKGCNVRRLTHLSRDGHGGIAGSRHWLRSTPDGSEIIFLSRDSGGIVQAWSVGPAGGAPRQITRCAESISTAYTISPDGEWLCCFEGQKLIRARLSDGKTEILLPEGEFEVNPCPVVFSPDGQKIVYERKVPSGDGKIYTQLFIYEAR